MEQQERGRAHPHTPGVPHGEIFHPSSSRGRAGAAKAPGPVILEPVPGLIPMPGLRIAFSTRVGGVSRGRFRSLNLGGAVGDERAALEENRRRFLTACGVSQGERIYETRQVHGARVIIAPPEHRGSDSEKELGPFQQDTALEGEPASPEPSFHLGGVGGAGAGDGEGRGPRGSGHGWDGIVTDEAGAWVMGIFADCVPIYLIAPDSGVFGLVHAGWRGTAGSIAAAAVAAVTRRWGTPPQNLFAVIGPSIGPCCYRVGREVADAVAAAVSRPVNGTDGVADGGFHVDLKHANSLILQAAGVPAENIFISRWCTACHPRMFFSHRVSTSRGEKTPGRMAALIGLARS